MASKTVDEILKNMPPESRAAIEKMSPETKSAVQQTGQGLEKQGVAEKPEYQTNAGRPAQIRTSEPPDQMPKQEQRGAAKIQQAMEQSQQPKEASQEKTAPEKAPEPER
ncbi:hypothetical protein [Larkinella terrae]|uniref:Uncharacterized protein n=1 Tax=Larkinella terrae TaxID=2025311 RepID=A0A7K0EMT2_9BACT|nr:hypothetical protein [Larkinella terrae]MRS63109.1 hypothetical protein [Larkinella terrae]